MQGRLGQLKRSSAKTETTLIQELGKQEKRWKVLMAKSSVPSNVTNKSLYSRVKSEAKKKI